MKMLSNIIDLSPSEEHKKDIGIHFYKFCNNKYDIRILPSFNSIVGFRNNGLTFWDKLLDYRQERLILKL